MTNFNLAILLLALLSAFGIATAQARPSKPRVGVVDEKLLPQSDWVSAWASDWEAPKIVALFRAQGLDAEVIGAATIRDLQKLKAYDAVLIPGDHAYPDDGARVGPVARALAAYVRGGGIYIMPMGASHSRWKDIATGRVSEDMGAKEDFLGLHWRIVGPHLNSVVPVHLTDAGKHAGLNPADLPTNAAAYARSFTETGLAYVSDDAGHPCLYAAAVGDGVVLHYAGGLPLDRTVRDWLISAYSAILRAGIDRDAVRKTTWESIAKSRVYTTVPVSRRSNEINLNGTWELAEATGPTVDLDNERGLDWTPVQMPNSIQNALFQAGRVPNPWFSDNGKQLQWISQRDWCLRKRFRIPDGWAGQHLRLRFDGMDYVGTVWLDGKPLGTHEGMLGGPTFDVDLKAGSEHELLVRIQAGAGDCTAVIKPDLLCGKSFWGNKYWSLGLWAPVRLIATGEAYMEAPLVRTDSIGPGSALLWAQAMIFNTGAEFRGLIRSEIVGPDGVTVWRGNTKQAVPNGGSFWEQSIQLPNPKLWWPNGLGDHPLYRLRLWLVRDGKTSDTIETRFGIRTLEFRRNPSFPDSPRRVEGATTTDEGGAAYWDWEAADEAYRLLFVVNGRPFFAKGASWLTSDDLLTLNPDRERWMVTAAKNAGIRLFRLNAGTSLFETDRFYDLCDENGILVWQEVPLNWADKNTAPLAAWRDQLTQSVLRIRQHPSLALYVGGNEFNPVAPGLSAVIGVAREIVDGFDNRPFRMSSPGAGRIDKPGGGTYHAYIIPEVWSGDPNWYFQYWGKGANFVSEWSLYAYNNYSCIRRAIPKAELEDDHVGLDFKAFAKSHPILNVERFAEPYLAPYIFQKASWYSDLSKATLAEFAENSQMGHAETFGYVFEHWRGDFPFKGGQTVWTWNVPEPANSWNVIDWFGQPVPAYYWVKRANEPVHVMAKTTWFSWGPGDTFHASVQAVNDGAAPLPRARIRARVLDRNMHEVASKDWVMDLPGMEIPSPVREIDWHIPADTPESYFFLIVSLSDAAGKRLSQQVYWMRTLHRLADPEARRLWQAKPETDPLCDKGPWLRPQLASLPTSLQAKVTAVTTNGKEANVTLVVKNTGSTPAFPVRVGVLPDAYSNVWDDNFLWLAPGESRELRGTIRLDMKGMDPITSPPIALIKDLSIECGAWNAKTVRLPLGVSAGPVRKGHG
ncbi:MAG: glycosyl hydrolase 2 galactose-binding domain-containing protein [Fimbriimonadales bacterium]